ncbi:MAG: 3-oxoacyl-ACP reductase FabG [Parabacteroides sp.]|nr:3-oxoacyl-ACP reductase FabG [Parabacteroides sp.]
MRYALITGGSRGIGRAICLKLASMDYAVLINYSTNVESAIETQKLITDTGGMAELLPFDVSDPKSVDAALEQWCSNHPEEYISVLVNNAGIRRDALMIFMQNEQWTDVINTDLNSFFYVTRRLLKDMLIHRYGRIINIGSLSGLRGLGGQTNYSAAKAAMIGATKALAQEVASRKVTVNVVAPGFISTNMTKDLDEKNLQETVPMKRFGKPEEVAALVGFLASDDAAYITGEVISINGGLS